MELKFIKRIIKIVLLNVKNVDLCLKIPDMKHYTPPSEYWATSWEKPFLARLYEVQGELL